MESKKKEKIEEIEEEKEKIVRELMANVAIEGILGIGKEKVDNDLEILEKMRIETRLRAIEKENECIIDNIEKIKSKAIKEGFEKIMNINYKMMKEIRERQLTKQCQNDNIEKKEGKEKNERRRNNKRERESHTKNRLENKINAVAEQVDAVMYLSLLNQ